MDITVDDEQLMIFRHESFQLWESECTGFLLNNKNKDFVTLGKAGMEVLSLGSQEKRTIVDTDGIDRMVHSLEAYNFLKVDKNNYLLFECAKTNQRVVSVQQEYVKGDSQSGEEAAFWNLYNVKLNTITLRELLLF
jgi:anion-transporting  ArsA/GET3 family ATPase